jgi:hypothetical protein
MRWLAAASFALAIIQPIDASGQQLPPASGLAQPAGDPSVALQLQSLSDYMGVDGGQIEISQLGITVGDGNGTLDGNPISGASVLEVSATGPAAKALDSHRASHLVVGGALVGTALAAGLFFPPALIGVAILASSHVGETYDLVIAIDGYRVRNTPDLIGPLEEARAGD